MFSTLIRLFCILIFAALVAGCVDGYSYGTPDPFAPAPAPTATPKGK